MLRARMEKPSQRLHYRVTAPLVILLRGVECRTVDWSVGGFRIPFDVYAVAVGEAVELTVTVPFQSFQISFGILGEIVRLDHERGHVAGRFVELGERERDLLEHFVEDIVRGSMTSAEDTIRRIDTPVTPVSTKPDVNALKTVPARRWSSRQIGMITFYLAIGAGLFTYIAITVVSLFTTIEVRSAVMTAPIETILASTSGVIVDLPIGQGTTVAPGTILMRIEDANLEEAIDRARIKISGAEDLVDEKKAAFDLALERLDHQRLGAGHEVRLAEIRVRDLERRLEIVDARLSAQSALRKQGLLVQPEVDKTSAARSVIVAELEGARANVLLRRELMTRIADGFYFDGRSFDDRLLVLQEELNTTEGQLEQAKRQLQALMDQRDRISVRAPSPGRLVRKLKSVGSGVKRGEVVALFERAEARTIEAFLTNAEMQAIDTTEPVAVVFPSTGQATEARVSEIDPSGAYVDQEGAQYTWRGQNERTVRVTLMPSVDAGRVAPGSPAIVFFSKRSLSERTASLFGFSATPGRSAPIPVSQL